MGIEVLPKRLQAVEGSYEQLSDMGVRKELLEPFDDLIRTCEDILHDEAMRKKKHETGIQEARRKGIRIGRPPVPISMDFLKLEGLYSKKVITAGEAAGRRHHAHVQTGGDPRPAARPHVRRAGVRRLAGARARHRPHQEGGREPGGEEHAGASGRVLRVGHG